MPEREKRLFKKEKTYADSKGENYRRLLVLRSTGSQEGAELAEKLLLCEPKNPCRSGACHSCNWLERHLAIRQAMKIFDGLRPVYMLTLLPPDMFMSAADLSSVDVRKLKNRINKQLSRSALKTAIIFGYVEAVFRPELNKLSVHLHLIIGGASLDAVEDFRRYYAGYREMRVDRVTIKFPMLLKVWRKSKRRGESRRRRMRRIGIAIDESRRKTMSYALKNTTGYRKSKNSRYRAAPEDVETAHLLWLDKTSFRQRLYLQGLQYRSDKMTLR